MFVHNILESSFKYPIKNFHEITRYPPPLGVNKLSPNCLDMLEKIVLLNIFPIFLKKIFHIIKISKKKTIFIEIFNWFRENFSKLSNYYNKGTFFSEIFCLKNGKKF